MSEESVVKAACLPGNPIRSVIGLSWMWKTVLGLALSYQKQQMAKSSEVDVDSARHREEHNDVPLLKRQY